jgi:lipopolysaccharide/colanic/teichoic acid biosynthesis glycosyltransferase/acetyltransferase-like isoleucine patch superfamily enzyme
MNMIVIYKNQSPVSAAGRGSLLQFAMGVEPLAARVFSRLAGSVYGGQENGSSIMIPADWDVKLSDNGLNVTRYDQRLPLLSNDSRRGSTDSWFTLYNGRFITRIQHDWLCSILDQLKIDIAFINVTPQLQAFYEKTLITSQDNLVGFRRFYDDSLRPTDFCSDWPHCLFIKTSVLDKVAADHAIPFDFTQFVNHCLSNSLTVQGLDVGGVVLDLDTEEGLVGLLRADFQSYGSFAAPNDADIADSAKLFGEIRFGRNVRIGPDAIIAGPVILGDDVVIGRGSAVRSSILASGVSLPPDSLVQDRVLLESKDCNGQIENTLEDKHLTPVRAFDIKVNHFRTWPLFSYAGCFKRIADIIISIIVLILFAPIILLVILVIKLASPGPVFFKHKRQGRHGKPFGCLKFRTMIVGADEMQDKIRRLNQVDGPQFRIDDDPRISSVGRFLRDTYLDEIPQFVNVLLGQMSIVGPRPSPKLENTLCPSWHDARLSVRPGVTGLWQICRTRQPMQDFQEWIYYDIQYVKNLSVFMDLNICWLTAKKMFGNFIHQF